MDNKTPEQIEAERLAAEQADKLAADEAAAKAAKKTVKARVLVDGSHGKCNDVVHVTAADLKAGEAAGELDGNKAAVAHAESLKA